MSLPCIMCHGTGLEELQSGPYFVRCFHCGGTGLRPSLAVPITTMNQPPYTYSPRTDAAIRKGAVATECETLERENAELLARLEQRVTDFNETDKKRLDRIAELESKLAEANAELFAKSLNGRSHS